MNPDGLLVAKGGSATPAWCRKSLWGFWNTPSPYWGTQQVLRNPEDWEQPGVRSRSERFDQMPEEDAYWLERCPSAVLSDTGGGEGGSEERGGHLPGAGTAQVPWTQVGEEEQREGKGELGVKLLLKETS